jgi:hypothetical protein
MTAAAKTHELIEKKPHRSGVGIRFECVIALLLTAAALVFHIRYFLNAGGLWRDEITSVGLAGSHSFADAVANMNNDSFPILWVCVLRFWEKSGIGATDHGMRLLGLLAGIGILAALWRNARRFGLNTPVVSIALLGFTSSVVCYGDSIRAYGLGMFLGLCTIGVIWSYAIAPTRGRFTIALVVALMSVHMLFYNCIILLAACCGAAAVTLPKRQWKRTVLIFLIGFICAITMFIYVPMIQRTRDIKMFQIPLDVWRLVARLRESFQFGTEGNVEPGHYDIVWGAVTASAVLVALGAWCAKALRSAPQLKRDSVMFCAACLIVGIGAYWTFLQALHYPMEPWYFLAAMAMVATCLDGLFGAIRASSFRILLCLCAVAFAINSVVPLWKNVGIRRTNMDIIAAQLQTAARSGDVILIDPWDDAVTFKRYYHGEVRWTTIPEISFFEYNKFDQLLKYMTDRHVVEPLNADLSAVLREGHRVWVISTVEFPEIPIASPHVQDAPDPLWGWRLWEYQMTWDNQVLYFLKSNSKRVEPVPVANDRPINHDEVSQLWYVEGWHENSASVPAK